MASIWLRSKPANMEPVKLGFNRRPCTLHVVFSDQTGPTWLAAPIRGRSWG